MKVVFSIISSMIVLWSTFVWIWMSLFIIGAEKLAVIDFVHEVGSPLSESRIAVLTSPSYRWT